MDLKNLAWRRNGQIGRIYLLRSHIRNLIVADEFLLTKKEKQQLYKIDSELNEMLDNKDQNWENIKEEFLKRKEL